MVYDCAELTPAEPPSAFAVITAIGNNIRIASAMHKNFLYFFIIMTLSAALQGTKVI